MKKLLLFLMLCPLIASAQLTLPYSIKINNAKPLDYYYYESDGTPYDSEAEVIAAIPAAIRYQGMTVNVNGIDYQFFEGTDDADLVVKYLNTYGFINVEKFSDDVLFFDPIEAFTYNISWGNDAKWGAWNLYSRVIRLQSSTESTGQLRSEIVLSTDLELTTQSLTGARLDLYRGGGLTSGQGIAITDGGMVWRDYLYTKGMSYFADYSTNGISQYGDRWIPDYGAVKTYADGKVAASITNGVTTSAPNQDQVFDALALKQDALTGLTASVTELNYTDGVTSAIQTQLNSKTTTALTASTGSSIAFDIPRRYGTTASPVTGNITYNSTGAVVGQVQTMIHNDSSEPAWGSEFDIISGTYTTSTNNKIMLFLVESGVVWVTISQ